MELKEDKNRIRLVVGWIVDIAVVISIAWFAVFAMGTQIRVSGQSMEPVLSQNEKVLMNRLSYRVMRPKRYDIIVVERPELRIIEDEVFEKETGNYNIKRVIGLPGETVQIKDGYIYINNEKLDAPNDLGKAALAGLAEYPISLDKNEYFLLGDNRSGSEDSRFSNVGNVKFRQIKGKVWLRIQPVSRFGLISSR